MQNTETKTNNSVKSKLVAAIAMLLVATIMVVSSTYAWFTLSTKPEVTGISTAVGANGALEIALANWEDGQWVQPEGTTAGKTVNEKNIYWGNLVDLSDASYYGSDKIVLYPSKLNTENGSITLGTPIQTPQYGADGRVTELKTGGMFGKYVSPAFKEVEGYYGFRALGIASGLTARQQAYRTALSQITVKQSSAQSLARNSLSTTGTTLAGIAVKKAMTPEATYARTEIDAVGSMIGGLKEALAAVEAAYVESIYAIILGKQSGLDDEVATNAYTEAKAAADTAVFGGKVEAAIDKINEMAGKEVVTTAKLTEYQKFTTAVTNLSEAEDAYNAIIAETCTWNELSPALTKLVKVDAITVNDVTVEEIKTAEGKQEVASAYTATGSIIVAMPTGAGIYADIADYTGDYTVSITFNTGNLGVGVAMDVPANMKTATTSDPVILAGIRETVGASANYPSSEGTDNAISEFYGYVIDLAFRTNASSSNLLLQTAPADRIYNQNENESTAGKGSNMTFSSTDSNFSDEKILKLMDCLEIVFYETLTGEVYAKAKLNTEDGQVTTTSDGSLQANLYIIEKTDTGYDFKAQADAKIVALNPNEAKYVSALVYLDGEKLTNADVSATEAQSIAGTLNLQFASSATLVPMEYGDLHQVTE